MNTTTGTSGLNPNDYALWMRFTDGSAALRRVVSPGGQKAIVLTVRDRSRIDWFRDRAAECGLEQLPGKAIFRALIGPDGRPPVPVRQMAKILGAEAFPILRKDLAGPDFTIHLDAPAPRNAAPKDTAGSDVPPPERDAISLADLTEIGPIGNDTTIFRDPQGGRVLIRNRTDRGPEIVRYEEGRHIPIRFLHARTQGDLDTIASVLISLAERRTLHAADHERVVGAALEGWNAEDTGMSLKTARRRIALLMLRQIGEIAIRDRNSAESLQVAMRTANACSFVLSRELEGKSGFSPSPMMTVFLRRMVRDGMTVDMSGNSAFAASMPRSLREDSLHQFHDLTMVEPGLLRDRISNILARRPEGGHSLLVLAGSARADHVDQLRSDFGVQYALETVAEVTSAVATGRQDAEPVTVLMIGQRRPAPLEALPQAAMRTFDVLTVDDLKAFEREVMRARLRIRDFHREEIQNARNDADNREENLRQRPYQPLSQVSEPFTMVPIALEGATTIALDRVRRDFHERGGVDAAVAFSLGMSMVDLSSHLTAEQVDAVALRMHAADRGRGFLLADQTGIGKGRTLAAIAAQEMRGNGKRVLYFTERASINVRDVARDLLGVGVRIVDAQSLAIQDGETRVAFLTTGSVFQFKRRDDATGLEADDMITSLTKRERDRAMNEGVWPKDADIVITTYSQFNFKEDSPKAAFLDLVDENTLVVMDEAHNALNPRSNIGRNLRRIINRAGRSNAVFGTATYARSSAGLDLYRPLLPALLTENFFENLQGDGEIALESFSTMLAQDGVMIRRDHDLSNIDFQISIPDDETMAGYQAVMDRFSPVVEMMIDASTVVNGHIGRASAAQYNANLARGMSPQQARALSNELNQYSIAIGSPLSTIARIAMNAIRVDQLVDAVVEEIEEGRKPLITFHSTNEALLREFCQDNGGQIDEELMERSRNLTFRDQVHRIHESIYRVTIDGERQDARQIYPDIQDTYEMVRMRINELPEDLPVSPIDALIERLEVRGYSVGEISGRSLCYRDGCIQRRQGRDRTAAIDAFNNGDLDILIYNGAGATGGSYHAAPNVRDQRPRTMLEFEPPLDPIKYIQGLGRGNRYGQVARPRVRSVVTGLTPEMRIMQQRNNKLRMLGASVDGNRAHPMLLGDVPDLLNKVGDEAARNVLLSMPAMARRLGFPEFAEENRNADQNAGNDAVDEGAGNSRALDSLANKVLSRSLSLSARDQSDLVERIVVEFEALIEELESRNANPLRPKQLPGEIAVVDSGLFSGQERLNGDLDASAFTSPLYLKTGIHRFNEDAWTGEKLISEIEASQRLYGTEGLAPWAERIGQNMGQLLRTYVPDGMTIEEALAEPQRAGTRFSTRHAKLTNLQWLLENIRPGVAMRFPSEWDSAAEVTRVIVGVQPPRHLAMFDTPAAYRMKTISAGDSRPQTTSLSRIMHVNMDRIIFMPGMSEGPNERFMVDFDNQALLTRSLPVQILTGNILSAMQEARRHDLGTVSLYRDTEGTVHRGIVISRFKVDLSNLPVEVPSGDVAAEAARMYSRLQGDKGTMRIYISMDPERAAQRSSEEDGIITITPDTAVIDFIALRRSNYEFFASRPGLYDEIHGQPLPELADVRARVARSSAHRPIYIDLSAPDRVERVFRILSRLGSASMVTNGHMRGLINEAAMTISRIREGYVRAAGAAPTSAPESAPEVGAPDAAAEPVGGVQQTMPPEPEGEPDFETLTFEV